jgi:hypothetical protein
MESMVPFLSNCYDISLLFYAKGTIDIRETLNKDGVSGVILHGLDFINGRNA